MAFDDSFNYKASISRFLYRCPRLRSNPKFISLLQNGRRISTEDVAATFSDPFLHPSYTIPVMRCFHSICMQILQRALTKLYSIWSFELEPEEDGEEIGEDDLQVIDFYVKRGRKQKLDELACLAFCRAVNLDPCLLQPIIVYFQFAPPPFRRLLLVETKNCFTEKFALNILYTSRVSLRLLALKQNVFSKLWDWSTFLDLVRFVNSLDMETVDPTFSYLLDIKWTVNQILCIAMGIIKRTLVFEMTEEDDLMCLYRWKEFILDTSTENDGWYLEEVD